MGRKKRSTYSAKFANRRKYSSLRRKVIEETAVVEPIEVDLTFDLYIPAKEKTQAASPEIEALEVEAPPVEIIVEEKPKPKRKTRKPTTRKRTTRKKAAKKEVA